MTIEQWLDAFDKSATHLGAMAEKSDSDWKPETVSDPMALHNMYVRALIDAYAAKFSQLSRAVVTAVRDEQYLVYALAGRSLIETAATLRFYVEKEYKCLMDLGHLGGKEMRALIAIDDKHLRGGRFDWVSFSAGLYDEMATEAVRELASKKQKTVPRYVPPNLVAEQRNVYTCVEHWARAHPRVLVVYNLFCELVHPNVGSNFLVAYKHQGQVSFGRREGDSIGATVMKQSLPLLGATAIKPFGLALEKLMATIWDADQLSSKPPVTH